MSRRTKINYGFTLLELLMVITILGVISVIMLILIDAPQQLARSKDTGRLSAVLQYGHAVQGYYVSRGGVYPPQNSTWLSTLVDSKEISGVTENPSYHLSGGTFPGCATGFVNEKDWCYGVSGSFAVVYVPLDSRVNKSKCFPFGSSLAYTVYATRAGRGGIMCTAPSANENGSNFIE